MGRKISMGSLGTHKVEMWQRLVLEAEEKDHAIQLLCLDKGKDLFFFFPLLCIFLYIIQLATKKKNS